MSVTPEKMAIFVQAIILTLIVLMGIALGYSQDWVSHTSGPCGEYEEEDQ